MEMKMLDDNMDFVRLFEEKLCKYTKFNHAVTTDCCTNAILISFEYIIRKYKLNKNNVVLQIPYNTYMSVPMTLFNNGWNIELVDKAWTSYYEIVMLDKETRKPLQQIDDHVYDCAVFFDEYMANDIPDANNVLACVSFQQKKRLALGRGGAVLFNNLDHDNILRRLRYDGRNQYLGDAREIENVPHDIVCGYHCYLEPDKCASGILKLNQAVKLPPFVRIDSEHYVSLKPIEHLFKHEA